MSDGYDVPYGSADQVDQRCYMHNVNVMTMMLQYAQQSGTSLLSLVRLKVEDGVVQLDGRVGRVLFKAVNEP